MLNKKHCPPGSTTNFKKELTHKLADIKPWPDIFQNPNRLNGKHKYLNFILTKKREPICSDAGKAIILAESFEGQLDVSPQWKDPTITVTVQSTVKEFISRNCYQLTFTFSSTNLSRKPTDSRNLITTHPPGEKPKR